MNVQMHEATHHEVPSQIIVLLFPQTLPIVLPKRRQHTEA
jgi:hypothetical protein